MMKINICKCVCVMAALVSGSLQAQNLRLKGTVKGADVTELALKVKAMEQTEPSAMVDMVSDGDAFHGELAPASDGFYVMYGNNEGRQLVAPFYFPDATKVCKLKLSMENGCPMLDAGKDNKALSAFNALTYERGKYFWMKGKDLGREELITFLKSYEVSADSIVERYRCSAPVANYLKLWAYVTAYGNYEGVPADVRANLELSELLGEPSKVLDTPMAAYFPSITYLVYYALPKGSLSERMDYLFGHYQTESIRKKVGDFLSDNFVRRFDYSGDFDGGLAELDAIVKKYGLDESHVQNFSKRKSSKKGKPFPDGVTLVDVDGNKVGISDFKGRYVYIDLWASWCAPCVKEVPFLQKMEKELENKDVVFVSISLDKDEKAWRAKMKALNMHGHQLLNQDNSLADALNVRGIPCFIIYDKEGRLYMSNAPRPSNPALKELLEGLH